MDEPSMDPRRGPAGTERLPHEDAAASGDVRLDDALIRELTALEASEAELGSAGQEDDESGTTVAAIEELYGDGEQVGRIGECKIVVSSDGLRASLQGRLPKGTEQKAVLEALTRAGITFGVVPGKIFEALPRRAFRRGRRQRNREEERAGNENVVVVAVGRAPVPPGKAQIRYLFELVPEDQVALMDKALRADVLPPVERMGIALPFVRAGQTLARVECRPGRSGRDVYGRKIAPPAPPGAQIQAGENVEVAEDGQSAVAEISGYAGVMGGRVTVLPAVWVAPDLMSAYFISLRRPGGGPGPTAEEVRLSLEEQAIIHGIDTAAVKGHDQTRDEETPGRAVRVAQGTEAVQGTKMSWAVSLDARETHFIREIERVLSRARRVDYVELYGPGLAARAVNAGELLALRRPGLKGEMGTDVFGEQFMPDEPRDERLEAGDHVAFSEDGSSLAAQIYGYAGLEDETLRVISPIWVDPERARAYFVNLPQLGRPRCPSPEEVEKLLELAGVCYGIDHRAIGVMCEKMRQGIPQDLLIPIAQRRAPVDGIDGRFEFAVDVEPKPGFIRQDGTVDYRLLNLAPPVSAGSLIAVNVPATRGAAGTDLRQRPIAARDGEDIRVDLGPGVRAMQQEEGQPTWFLAEIDGALTWVDRRDRRPPSVYLSVRDTLTVNGDVDYHTGNIDHAGNVEISGSVRSGFEVKAAGNIAVAHGIEDGAVVEAQGDVAVAHGIVGERVRVRGGGSVFAKFVSGAHIRAGGDLVVGEYISRASVKADNDVQVLGRASSRRSGAIIGGVVMAGRTIRVQHLGSEAGEPTAVIAGIKPSWLQKIGSLQRFIERSQAATEHVFGLLGVDPGDARRAQRALLQLVLRARGARREVIARSVKKVLALRKRCDQARKEKQELEAELGKAALEGSVEVAGTVAAGSLIRIGEKTQKVKEETGKVIFHLVEAEDDQVELRMDRG